MEIFLAELAAVIIAIGMAVYAARKHEGGGEPPEQV